jgi:hypothetical protein
MTFPQKQFRVSSFEFPASRLMEEEPTPIGCEDARGTLWLGMAKAVSSFKFAASWDESSSFNAANAHPLGQNFVRNDKGHRWNLETGNSKLFGVGVSRDTGAETPFSRILTHGWKKLRKSVYSDRLPARFAHAVARRGSFVRTVNIFGPNKSVSRLWRLAFVGTFTRCFRTGLPSAAALRLDFGEVGILDFLLFCALRFATRRPSAEWCCSF